MARHREAGPGYHRAPRHSDHSKIHRALSGFASRDDEIEDDVQNDWNGSAKVARVAIAETTTAWETILAAGEAPVDAPLRELVGVLARLDAMLAQRFPRATEFVRPGFDEPDIAAGALSMLAPFEPRHENPGKPRA